MLFFLVINIYGRSITSITLWSKSFFPTETTKNLKQWCVAFILFHMCHQSQVASGRECVFFLSCCFMLTLMYGKRRIARYKYHGNICRKFSLSLLADAFSPCHTVLEPLPTGLLCISKALTFLSVSLRMLFLPERAY